tara:strand:+ start:1330 stop:1548 length:219 start_codon:yes stop_codon:yes gene_type:complete
MYVPSAQIEPVARLALSMLFAGVLFPEITSVVAETTLLVTFAAVFPRKLAVVTDNEVALPAVLPERTIRSVL